MIKITEIKKSITTLLKQVKDIDVFFTNVTKSDSDNSQEKMYEYFHVSLIPISASLFGKLMRDRAFFVDVACINDYADTNTFYELHDQLDNTFLPYVQIGRRFITIESTSFKVVDKVGHYTFTLQFRDVIDYEQTGDVATDLNIQINKEEK